MKLVFETRFSYVGQSGWKSEASQNPELLFAPDRMEARFNLFSKITLPSLAAQTDDDFELLILTSKLMPKVYKIKLASLCNAHLGHDRVRILDYGPFKAGRVFRNFVRDTYGEHPHVAQVVLDDDDAVSADFVEICKAEARKLAASDYEEDYGRFLSFSRGYSLLVQDGQLQKLSPKHSPYLNLGLTLVAPPNTMKNPFLVSHLAIGERHPGYVVNTLRPFYLRTVHDHNDSRTPHKTDWLSDDEVLDAQQYFPLLADHFTSLKPAA